MKTHKSKVLERNNALFDGWSIAHLMSGIIMGWLLAPWLAILLLILWEPIEIFWLSKLLKRYKLVFGHETLQNSLSDIVVDVVGVIIGFLILRA